MTTPTGLELGDPEASAVGDGVAVGSGVAVGDGLDRAVVAAGVGPIDDATPDGELDEAPPVHETRATALTTRISRRGSTVGITTLEFEPGCVSDLKRALEKIAPSNTDYAHNARWGDEKHYSIHGVAGDTEDCVVVFLCTNGHRENPGRKLSAISFQLLRQTRYPRSVAFLNKSI